MKKPKRKGIAVQANRPKTASKTARRKTISFLIGIITVVILALLIFQHAQTNNYKEILGQGIIENGR